MNNLVEELELKLTQKDKENREIRDKVAKNSAINEGQVVHDQLDFFSKLLEEKEKKIECLNKQAELLLVISLK